MKKGGVRRILSELKIYFSISRNKKVMLLGGPYNWDYIKEELSSNGINPFYILFRGNQNYWVSSSHEQGMVEPNKWEDIWRNLTANPEFMRYFTINGINLYPILKRPFCFLFKWLVKPCIDVYECTSNLLRKNKIKAVLVSTFLNGVCCSISKAARDLDIPVIVWQHGGYFYRNHMITNYIDLMCANFHFSWGEGVIAEFNEMNKLFGANLRAIGSPMLERLFQKSLDGKIRQLVQTNQKVVLYVTSIFYHNTYYVSSPPPQSDISLWRTQQEIVESLANHTNFQIVVKLLPDLARQTPLLKSHILEKGFQNIQVLVDECSFTDLLPIADLIVMDYPSTALLKALTTSKPIFVYEKLIQISPSNVNLLKRRAFCYEELAELINDLEQFLTTGKIEKKSIFRTKVFYGYMGYLHWG